MEERRKKEKRLQKTKIKGKTSINKKQISEVTERGKERGYSDNEMEPSRRHERVPSKENKRKGVKGNARGSTLTLKIKMILRNVLNIYKI